MDYKPIRHLCTMQTKTHFAHTEKSNEYPDIVAAQDNIRLHRGVDAPAYSKTIRLNPSTSFHFCFRCSQECFFTNAETISKLASLVTSLIFLLSTLNHPSPQSIATYNRGMHRANSSHSPFEQKSTSSPLQSRYVFSLLTCLQSAHLSSYHSFLRPSITPSYPLCSSLLFRCLLIVSQGSSKGFGDAYRQVICSTQGLEPRETTNLASKSDAQEPLPL
jgi:hypothetical protein